MKKKIMIVSIIFMSMLFNFKIKAATFKDNQVVQATKSWTIHFNQEVSFDDLSKQGITVLDSSGNNVGVGFSLGNDNKTITVTPPAGGYKAGAKYKLIIGSKVHSKQNKNIKQQSVMNFSIEKSNEDDVVTFKDANLEKVVRDSINKPTGVLYKKDVDKITFLDAKNKNIAYLDGIEELTNLNYLSLANNQITNIDLLQNLHNLNTLIISDNPIKDISALENLNNLNFLNFDGELFDIDSLKQIKGLNKIYSYYIKDLNHYYAVYNKCEEILKSIIEPGMSDLQKEKAIHDYIVLNTKYDYDNYLKNTISDDDASPYGILINGTGVCNGYAYTTKLLLNMVGIKCIVVVGEASGQSHAWNIVQIGGKNCQLDTTWDDPVPDVAGYVRYDYFNVSDKELSKDHTWDPSYPKCPDSINPDGTERNSTNGQDEDTVITFKDSNFEQLVRNLLHKYTGDIYKSDVENIKSIEYCPTEENKKITDLSGIENFENLESINLKGNNIESIEPLKNLKNLYRLGLDNNNISDINSVILSLRSMPKLGELSLENNNISNIDELSTLTNLYDLDLSNNKISNINSLKDMVNLTILNLSNNSISSVDALNNLTKLNYLYLDHNNIGNIDSLKGMVNLESLYLDNNNISNIDALSALTKLSSLQLPNNNISNIGILNSMVNLQSLDLRHNNISNINVLEDCTKLNNLLLNDNEIEDISCVKKMPDLKCLWLDNNNISNIDALSDLTNLNYLCLANNKIKDISVIKQLNHLKEVYISGNPINQSDINDLKKVLSNCNILY